jgi:mannosyltransferase OCH1-like enzyme
MIPKTIHQVWVPPGGKLSDRILIAIESWWTHHVIMGGWTYRLWTDADLDWLRHRDLYDQAPNLVPADAVGQLRADIARYEILERHGGLYVDIDTVALQPVDGALEGHDTFAAREDPSWIGNTYLGCTAGHPVMKELVANLRANINLTNGRTRPNRLTGPRYLTPIWQSHNGYVAPREQWFPYSYTDVKNGTVPTRFDEDVYATHLWNHTRELTMMGLA